MTHHVASLERPLTWENAAAQKDVPLVIESAL